MNWLRNHKNLDAGAIALFPLVLPISFVKGLQPTSDILEPAEIENSPKYINYSEYCACRRGLLRVNKEKLKFTYAKKWFRERVIYALIGVY